MHNLPAVEPQPASTTRREQVDARRVGGRRRRRRQVGCCNGTGSSVAHAPAGDEQSSHGGHQQRGELAAALRRAPRVGNLHLPGICTATNKPWAASQCCLPRRPERRGSSTLNTLPPVPGWLPGCELSTQQLQGVQAPAGSEAGAWAASRASRRASVAVGCSEPLPLLLRLGAGCVLRCAARAGA